MTNFQFKISVIVPVFNVMEYLERAMDSLFHQTLEDMEFVFVDDCSTDGSYEMLLAAKEINQGLYDRIQIVRHNQNRGVATARNTGLSIAKGEFLAAMDPDDWIDHDMFEKMLKKAEESQADIVWCDYFNHYQDRQVYVEQKFVESSLSCIRKMLVGKLLGGMCTKIVSHQLFIKHNIRYPDGLNMCEDLRVSVQLFYYADRVVHLDEGLYHYTKYREDSISTSSQFTPVINESWILNIIAIEDFLIEKEMCHLKKDIQILKLISKQNLLVRARCMEDYKIWKSVFPESSEYIWKVSLPWYYKVIASSVNKELWFIPRLWLKLKEIKLRIKNIRVDEKVNYM